ncbi:MAG: sigma 54-interacting transcriptional regulator [Pseudomonadota bacterium]
MTKALAIVVRSDRIKADIKEIVSDTSALKGLRRIYVIVSGSANGQQQHHRDQAKEIVRSLSDLEPTVHAPKELFEGPKRSLSEDLNAHRDYLDRVLWRQQASKETIVPLSIGASSDNWAGILAIASIATYIKEIHYWVAGKCESLNVSMPPSSLLYGFLRPSMPNAGGIEELIIGECAAIRKLRQQILDYAKFPFPVMIVGETGTGKELCAKALHDASGRKGRFLPVNAAFLADDRSAASELFGHVKGAFTDAIGDRQGRIREADGGTLFLDELNSLPIGFQAKLLRAFDRINEANVTGVPEGGAEKDGYSCDVRLVTATQAVQGKHSGLRDDLYHRMNTLMLDVPPLRLRGDDIITLARRFLVNLSRSFHRDPPRLDDTAEDLLRRHTWPGNVRELHRLVRQIFVTACVSDRADYSAADLQPMLVGTSHVDAVAPTDTGCGHRSLEFDVGQFIVNAINKALQATGGVNAKAARLLGLRNSQELTRKLEQAQRKVEKSKPASASRSPQ